MCSDMQKIASVVGRLERSNEVSFELVKLAAQLFVAPCEVRGRAGLKQHRSACETATHKVMSAWPLVICSSMLPYGQLPFGSNTPPPWLCRAAQQQQLKRCSGKPSLIHQGPQHPQHPASRAHLPH